MMVIAEMLGIPAADWPRFKRWSDAILKISYTVSGDEEAARALARVPGGDGRDERLSRGHDRASGGRRPRTTC